MSDTFSTTESDWQKQGAEVSILQNDIVLPAWEQDHDYVVGNVCTYNDLYYTCITAHNSGSEFSADDGWSNVPWSKIKFPNSSLQSIMIGYNSTGILQKIISIDHMQRTYDGCNYGDVVYLTDTHTLTIYESSLSGGIKTIPYIDGVLYYYKGIKKYYYWDGSSLLPLVDANLTELSKEVSEFYRVKNNGTIAGNVADGIVEAQKEFAYNIVTEITRSSRDTSISVVMLQNHKYYLSFDVTAPLTSSIQLRGSSGGIQTIVESRNWAVGNYIIPFICQTINSETVTSIRFGSTTTYSNVSNLSIDFARLPLMENNNIYHAISMGDDNEHIALKVYTNGDVQAKMPISIECNDRIYQAIQIDKAEANTLKLINLRTRLDNSISNRKQFCLLHITDIHTDTVCLQRLYDWKKENGGFIDDMLLTGDMSGSYWGDYSDAIESVPGYFDIMKVIGNHDVYDYNHVGNPYSIDPSQYAPNSAKYARYMQGIANWGVVQPSDVATTKACYYYKDYPLSKVRLIVLDCMEVEDMEAQRLWFTQVLNDTLESNNAAYGYHVIVARHIPVFKGADYAEKHTDRNGFLTGFNSLDDYKIQGSAYTNDADMDIVDTFINNGGVFICWLYGHLHFDYCGKTLTHPNQIYIGLMSSSSSEYMGKDGGQYPLGYSECAYNVYSIDTYTKKLRVMRIGNNMDRYLRYKNTMCIDYDKNSDGFGLNLSF
jgi:hypothetical protein